MGEFDFIGYFREVAERLTEIQHTEASPHFSRTSSIAELGEFLSSMRSSEGYQLIVIDNSSGRFIDRRSDNLLVQPYYSFYLLKQVTREDYDEKEQTIKDCTAVIKKILSKMFRDKMYTASGLTNLERDNITYNQAGPIGHNWYGLNVNFTLLDDPEIHYDEDDWEPIS
jgi:hypothetical protein